MSVSPVPASVMPTGREIIERERSAPPRQPRCTGRRPPARSPAPDRATNQPERADEPDARPKPEGFERGRAALQGASARQRGGQKQAPCLIGHHRAMSTAVDHPLLRPFRLTVSVQRRNRRSECSQRERPENGRITGGKTRPLTKACADVSACRGCRPLRVPGRPAFDRKCRFSHIPQWRALSCS